MKVSDKEFYELLDDFERIYNRVGAKREPKNLIKNQRVYCDGELNNLFWAFYQGYQLAQLNQNLEYGQ